MVRVFVIAAASIFVILCIIYVLESFANEDHAKRNVLSAEQKELYSAIKAAQDRREALYGNGHFIWHEDETDGMKVVTRQHEYWARDNQFFRLDTYDLVGGKPNQAIRRLIHCPEGTFLIEALSPSETGRVVKTSAVCIDGTCGPRPEFISGRYFVAHANRLATLQVKDWILLWTRGEYDISSFEIAAKSSSECKLVFVRAVDAGTQRHEVQLHPQDFRVLASRYEFADHNKHVQAYEDATLSYVTSNQDIPVLEQCDAVSSVYGKKTFECRLVEFDLDPASPDVFAIPKSRGSGATKP